MSFKSKTSFDLLNTIARKQETQEISFQATINLYHSLTTLFVIAGLLTTQDYPRVKHSLQPDDRLMVVFPTYLQS